MYAKMSQQCVAKLSNINVRTRIAVVLHKDFSFIFVFSYIVKDLDTSFGITMNLSVCFEATGACEKIIQVFNEHQLYEPFCNWTSGFAIKGIKFSFS